MKEVIFKGTYFKYILLIAPLLTATLSKASSECFGKTSDGKNLKVRIETFGAKGEVKFGEVIFEDGANHYGYQLSKQNITQYFEFDDVNDGSAVIGLVAYSGNSAPVSIKYVGPNFVDLDLKTVFEKSSADLIRGNFIRVWKGPGYEITNQVNLNRLVCATWPEI